MPEGGVITVSASNVRLGDKAHPTLAGGHYVRISIRDTGVGMHRDMLPKIFDPFFSTKAEGHGLGHELLDRQPA